MSARVLRVITRLTVSGPSMHVALLDTGLAERGWQTLLAHGTIEPDESEMNLDSIAVPVRRIRTLRRRIRPGSDARALVDLVRLMRRYRPDVVHTHQSKAGLLGRLAATLTRVPVRVHTFHGTVFEGYFSPAMSATIVLLERLMARASTRLIVLSEAQRAELLGRRIGRPDQVVVVPLGLDLAPFGAVDRADARAKLRIADDRTVILAVGRFAAIKRLDRLISVFSVVHARCPESILVLVGDGPARLELEALARARGVADAVRFEGWSDEMPAWYAAADIVANASDSEGTPLALIEAAASGRPAVATAVGGVHEVVIEGTTGFVVSREDEPGMADRIERLLGDPGLRASMGDAARSHAARFAGRRLVSDVDALYRGLLAGATR